MVGLRGRGGFDDRCLVTDMFEFAEWFLGYFLSCGLATVVCDKLNSDTIENGT